MLETRGSSEAFQLFLREAPLHAQAWTQAISRLDSACALDKKTESLAYISVLAALGRISGVPFHVAHAKSLGATRDEVVSAILVGLPAAGHGVLGALPVAVEAFDHPMARELPAAAR